MTNFDEERERIRFRVRITGTFQGKPFTYEDPPGDCGHGFETWEEPTRTPQGKILIGEYWWTEGNFACDCNRSTFIGAKLSCGDEICIDRIDAIDRDDVEPLVLSESPE